MNNQPNIQKNRILPDEFNFAVLRQKGVDYIQRLASANWTDYNYHDPGITILEVLCYVLTDCGYRSNYDIADLVARIPGSLNKDFYTAREILTINPTTIPDLRKYIIDQDGIQNAWLNKCKYDEHSTDPMIDQPAFYYLCDPVTKAYQIKMQPDPTFLPKYLNGLYDVVLQLEDDDSLGDLNDNVVEWQSGSYLMKVVFPVVEIIYPAWDYPINNILGYSSITLATAVVNGTGGTRSLDNYTLTFDGDPAKQLVFTNLTIILTDTSGTNTLPTNAQIAAELVNILTTAEWFGDLVFRRLTKILTLIREVYCALQKTRNLCEDYVKLSIVHEQEILLCADIDITAESDVQEIFAEIWYLVESFLSPEVKFYSLQEMYQKGKITEEIFEGPPLNHGFIDTGELLTCNLKTEVHTSDLYNIIMGIPGVTAVRSLLITNYLDGIAQTTGALWCLKLDGPYALHLKIPEEQKLHFFKDGIEFDADIPEVDLLIKSLEAQNSKPKLLNTADDLPVPYGTNRALSEYYSLQNDFPEVYKTGHNGITKADTPLRKAQTKQLKAYLLFFDQILTDFLGQLDLAKDLLSVGGAATLDHTYASLPVYDTPATLSWPNFYHVQNLFKDFVSTLPSGIDLDNETIYQIAWTNFISNNNNAYLQALRNLNENQELFYQRRNLFLDHLIARFAESFSGYVDIMFELFGNKTDLDIINDKVAFLMDYPRLSSQRGKAFQYACCNERGVLTGGWPLDNISGFQRRTCRLLGIDDPRDRPLVPLGLAVSLNDGFNVVAVGTKFAFQFLIGGIVELDSPTPNFNTIEDAESAIANCIIWAGDPNAYVIDTTHNFIFNIVDSNGTIVALHSTISASAAAAQTLIDSIVAAVKKIYYSEGFHIVEHILLRPVMDKSVTEADVDEGYFPACKMNEDCECPITDYYSFRVTVVMPYWPDRFRNMDFRNYAEQLMRSEAPAHVLLKICWVSPLDMYQFEYYYSAWLQLICALLPDRTQVDDALTLLIKKINTLTNVYPEGILHSCEEPSDKKSVILGQSALGTFDAEENTGIQ